MSVSGVRGAGEGGEQRKEDAECQPFLNFRFSFALHAPF